MNIPRGNVLLKPTILGGEDLEIHLSNLRQNGFNGYVRVDLGGDMFYIFLLEGLVRSVVQFSGRSTSLISELILRHSTSSSGNKSFSVASYVLAPEVATVLSGVYAFQEKYLNYQVRKKEFRKVLGTIDAEKTTGILEIVGSPEEDVICFVLNQGRIVTDNFLDAYGQIVTGPERVTEIIENISSEGGVVNTYGEKPDEIERRRKQVEEDLNRYKELVVSVESGGLRLGGSNQIRVDDSVLREWSRGAEVSKIEVFAPDGHFESYKVAGKKGLADKLVVSSQIQKKLGLTKEQTVLVRPGL